MFGNAAFLYELIKQMQDIGIRVEISEEETEHFAVIDHSLVWYGGMLPKGIRVGMSFGDVTEMFGDSLKESYSLDSDLLEYRVRFTIDDEEAIFCCNNYWELSNDMECSGDFVGFLYVSVGRSTGIVERIKITYAYDAANN